MSELGIVKSFYDALGRGDVTTVVAPLNDRLTRTEAVGFPYLRPHLADATGGGRPLVCPARRDWDGFKASADSFVSEGDTVVAFGAYSGLNRATGRTFSAAFAHHWHVTDT